MKISVLTKRIPYLSSIFHMYQLGITRRSPLPSLPNCHKRNCPYAACLISAHTDVFKMSSGRIKKVTTSYDQTRRCHDIWKKTLDLRRFEDVWFMSSWRRPIYEVLKTSDLRHLQDAWFTTSWRRLIYVVLKMYNLRCLENVWFTAFQDVWLTTSWRFPIYVVLKRSNLRRLEDVWFTTSSGHLV